jgi:hypothetical protein
MKFLKGAIASFLLYTLMVSTGSPFSSCTKKDIVNDTTFIHVHDTTVVNHHDTTIIVDSLYDLKDGLVAYYNFNGGNLNDSSGHGNNIFLNNSAVTTSDRFGNANNAFLFDGSTSFMQVHNSPSLTTSGMTLMAIVKVNAFNAGSCSVNQIVGKGFPDFANAFYCLRFSGPNPCSSPIDSAHEIFIGAFGDNSPQGTGVAVGSDTALVNKGQWYTIIFTYDGILARLYLNGQLKSSVSKSVISTENTNDLFIGKHGDPLFPYFFNGVIDEIRIYNRSLPTGAITLLSNLKN